MPLMAENYIKPELTVGEMIFMYDARNSSQLRPESCWQTVASRTSCKQNFSVIVLEAKWALINAA